MDASDLDYPLPRSAIAQRPVEPRDSARLLVAGDHQIRHRRVADLAELLNPGDVLVVNQTRVIPARLHLHKPTGGAVEVLLLERSPDGQWEGLVRPGRRVPPGTVLTMAAESGGAVTSGDDTAVSVEVGEALGDHGRRRIRLLRGRSPLEPALQDAWLAARGEVPLPPYISEPLADPERYQTVFAATPGSVAAPTAGLHLTDELLQRCRARGVTVAFVDLLVGLGTFKPIETERVEDHPMHAERYRIGPETVELLGPWIAEPRGTPGRPRVVAVGTTAVRALEAWAATGSVAGTTDLFIHGSYPFALVDRLLTNFHVPRSSLLALLAAFAGPGWRELYAVARQEGYRFLSFGDAMLVDRGALASPSLAGMSVEDAR